MRLRTAIVVASAAIMGSGLIAAGSAAAAPAAPGLHAQLDYQQGDPNNGCVPPPLGADGKPLPPPLGPDGRPLPPPSDLNGKPCPPPPA
ncbi:hypothetical protein [Nocardia sp. CS682]|uniref:hypothetical protein n=1 Tax=Nocardia sp. CS682 TaxID=1047172 RepID=UPI001074CBB4|nr:hypothetical protein [Nocardia sp. CS682]QBS40613.1 hypothetical protein DMB37_11225 [Nocardia sp. CS682]